MTKQGKPNHDDLRELFQLLGQAIAKGYIEIAVEFYELIKRKRGVKNEA